MDFENCLRSEGSCGVILLQDGCYNPEKMPENLRHAHERNDEVLERRVLRGEFPLQVYSHAGNLLASSSGAAVLPKGPSKMASALSGAMGGAGSGALTGAAIGAAGGPIGATGGAAIGLAGGFLSGLMS